MLNFLGFATILEEQQSMPARILIVEDNPTNLELMSYLLTAFGHTTLAACDGEEGIKVAQREMPDLIVCDIQLPNLDGYEVARRLKSNTAMHMTPLVAVTALAMVGDRDRVLAAGFDGYIAKPIAPETFVSQVEAFLTTERRSTSQQQAATTVATAAPVVARRTGTILAIDNVAANGELLRSIFEPFGYTVHLATNINQGLELARQEQPDIIISDLHMPDGNGFDLVKIVKADPTLQSVPFVFLSATAKRDADYRRGLELGAIRFIRRPIEPQQLLAEIEGCLGQTSAK
jgi:two-component system, cell cycle response regulator